MIYRMVGLCGCFGLISITLYNTRHSRRLLKNNLIDCLAFEVNGQGHEKMLLNSNEATARALCLKHHV